MQPVNRITELMNEEIEQPLAFESLLNRCMGEEEFARKILGDFLNSTPPLLKEIADSFQSKDLPLARKMVHRLKGTAATVSAEPLFQSLQALERLVEHALETDAQQDFSASWEQSTVRYQEVKAFIETDLLGTVVAEPASENSTIKKSKP